MSATTDTKTYSLLEYIYDGLSEDIIGSRRSGFVQLDLGFELTEETHAAAMLVFQIEAPETYRDFMQKARARAKRGVWWRDGRHDIILKPFLTTNRVYYQGGCNTLQDVRKRYPYAPLEPYEE
jgi:hypothetical protein